MRPLVYGVIFAAAYVILGQFVSHIRNPMVPGAIIAVNMVVVVISGILFGPVVGGFVGAMATATNGFLTPAQNAFERAAIGPHTLMGIAAGFAGRRSVFAGALTVMVGHALNVSMFLFTGLLQVADVTGALFFSGLLFEIVVDVVVVLFAVPLLRPITARPP